MTRHIRLAALWVIGAFIGFFAFVVSFATSTFIQILSVAPTIILQSLILWLAFNISVGSIISFPLSFIQSLGFVLLIRVVSKMFVNE